MTDAPDTPARHRPVTPEPVRRAARVAFGLDLRSLALMRMAIAGCVLVDLAIRAGNLTAHYTDDGVLPRSAATGEFATPWNWSLHLINGSWPFQAALFIVAALTAITMMVGYRTRVVTAVSWVLLVSLQNRNAVILDGGDVMLRMVLFWSMFLPLGARWSIDAMLNPPRAAARRTDAERPNHLATFATAAYIFQVGFIYCFAAVHKQHPVWTTEHSAVYYAMNVDIFAKSPAIWIRQFPGLMALMTIATLWLEGLGPLLILVPWRNHWFRGLAVLSFVGLHASFGLFMALGVFPLTGIAMWLAILPGPLWDRLEGASPFVALRTRLRDLTFKIVWRFRLPRPPAPTVTPRNATNVVVTALMLYVFLWNLRGLPSKNTDDLLPHSLDFVADALRLDQQWNMFAPYPIMDDGWLVITGTLADGSTVQLLGASGVECEGGPVSWDKPDRVYVAYGDQRTRKHRMNLWLRSHSDYRPWYARYLRRVWNSRHDASQYIVRLNIYYMREDTPPPGKPFEPIEKVEVWEHTWP
ncbi:MAG: hypothetical protein GC159_11790 [Phycisphaera sp.]|nr:hypothetical protein [Phycisphaera sp.]